MRVPKRTLLVCVVPMVAVTCTAGAPAANPDVDADAIRQIIAGYQQGLNSGDLETSVSMYADDAVFMPNESPPQAGLAAIRDYYRETTLATRFEAEFVPTDVQVSGDVAWATVAISGRQTPPGGDPFSLESKALFIFSRAPSGNWEVIRYMFNPNGPLPTASP